MENKEKTKGEIKIGELGYVNKNCWLARNLGYPPTKHCQYCQLKFHNCLFFRYSAISLILITVIFILSLLIEGSVSKLLITSVFTLIIIYGYFFDKSTENIIVANFAQKQAKEALEELTQNLQQKVDEQTKELKEAYELEKKAREELQSLDNAKNQFLLTIQHHLRTPLTSMMGYSDLLLKGAFGKPTKKITEVIKKFEISTQSLIKMVNEFLDITQFQLGKKVISLKPGIKILQIVEEIVNGLAFEAKSKGIYLKLEKPKEDYLIESDESKLKAALTNIIDNAVKYTNNGGVKVSIKNTNNKLLIEVKDTGIGIPKEKIGDMFDRIFERDETAKKTFVTGRGIGLYIANQIIKAHNGNIWAESDGVDKGSAFYIELPIEKHEK